MRKTTMTTWILSLSLVMGCAAKQIKQTSSLEAQPVAEATPVETSTPAPIQASNEELQQILLKLTRIHFAFDSAQLLPRARVELIDVAEQLIRYPDVQLILSGHADERGSRKYNLALSERRAHAVADFLSQAGVSQDRLQVIGEGAESPLSQDIGERAWAMNRRVDFGIVQNQLHLEQVDGTLFDDAGAPLPSLLTESAPATTKQPS